MGSALLPNLAWTFGKQIFLLLKVIYYKSTQYVCNLSYFFELFQYHGRVV